LGAVIPKLSVDIRDFNAQLRLQISFTSRDETAQVAEEGTAN